ncbi:hypothetical protein TNCV_2438211 [Trichonephila clavipes]|nr:hypothetical protein TNCV_2438211 [Trichonephila clavipes]
MHSSSPIGLSLCSWNANGLLRRNTELRILIEKHSRIFSHTKNRPETPLTPLILKTTPATETTESPTDRRWNSDSS